MARPVAPAIVIRGPYPPDVVAVAQRLARCERAGPAAARRVGDVVEVDQVLARLGAGPHVHVVCQAKDVEPVKAALGELSGIKTIIECGIGEGTRVIEEHLF